jgi:hypothetical protein
MAKNNQKNDNTNKCIQAIALLRRVSDSPQNNLGVEIICQFGRKLRFDWKLLVEVDLDYTGVWSGW